MPGNSHDRLNFDPGNMNKIFGMFGGKMLLLLLLQILYIVVLPTRKPTTFKTKVVGIPVRNKNFEILLISRRSFQL